ncbi:MAG TPA: hypothetical protein VGN34_14145, partial [Ktedonobacteraceae bacterium]
EPAQSTQTLSSPATSRDTSLQLEQYLETFWQSTESLESFAIAPHNPTIERAILKRLGPAPYSIGKENLSMLLARIYDHVEEAALNRAENEDL